MIKFAKDKVFYFVLLIVSAVGGFLLWKRFKSQPTHKGAEADRVLAPIRLDGVRKEMLKTRTMELAHHLGTAYGMYDPRSWTENDKEVFEIMQNLTKSEVEYVEKLYFEVYARGRSLKADLAKLLDAKYYSQLSL